MSALVQRDWLRDHTFAHYLELLRAMQQAGAAPWASRQRLERLAGSYGTPKPSAPETITFSLGLWAMAQLGLPADTPRRVERIENDLVTILTVTGMSTAPTVVGSDENHAPVIRETSFPRRVFSFNADHSMKLEPADSAAVYQGLTEYTGLPVVEPIELWGLVGNSTTILVWLHDRDLATMFGAPAWLAWKTRRTHAGHLANAGGRKQTVPRPEKRAAATPIGSKAPAEADRQDAHGGATSAARPVQVSTAELSPAEQARVAAWFQDIVAGQVTALPRELLRMVDEVEADPALGGAVRALLSAGQHDRTLDVITLRAMIDRARVDLERARLGLGAPQLHERSPREQDSFGIELPARLVQRGLLLSGRPAHFDLVFDWGVMESAGAMLRDAFAARAWRAAVEWVFERTDVQGPALPGGAPIAAPETSRTEHTSNEIGIDRTFQLAAHETRGVWTVHAFVHTSHFAPRHTAMAVEVQTEAARMTDLRREAFAGLAPDRAGTEAHTFEIGVTHRIASAAHVSDTNHRNADAEGTATRGALPSGFQVRTTEDRDRKRTAEVEQTEKLIEYLTAQHRNDNADAIAAAERRLALLRIASAQLRDDAARGWSSFELRGTYLSRQPEVPSGPLDLYGSVRRERRLAGFDVDHVEVQIRDPTQRLGPENFRFQGIGITFEAALEDAFVGLCKQYPEGRLAVMAQELGVAATGNGRSTGQVIGFELATTSPWKRLKSRLYNPVVQTVVNVATTALMVFQPELAPLIMPLLALSSTVNNLDELSTRYQNGTLSAGSASVTLAQIGLDFLPYARGARVLQTHARLVAFEVANHAGTAIVMGLRARDEIAQIQDGDIPALAERYRALVELEKSTNPSDPALAQKRAEIEAGAQHVRETTARVWNNAIRDNGIFIVGTHQLAAIQRARMAGVIQTEHAPAAPTASGDAVRDRASPSSASTTGDVPSQDHPPATKTRDRPGQGEPKATAAAQPRDPMPRGVTIASKVPGVRYEGTGRFRVPAGDRCLDVTIQRVHAGPARLRRVSDDDLVIEIPTGLGDADFDEAVIAQLRALREDAARSLTPPAAAERAHGEPRAPAVESRAALPPSETAHAPTRAQLATATRLGRDVTAIGSDVYRAPPGRLHELHTTWSAGKNTHPSALHYDPASNTTSFELTIDAKRVKIEAHLEPHVTSFAQLDQHNNRLLGTPIAAADGPGVLRALVNNDAKALHAVGVAGPARMPDDAKIEFGLGGISDGRVVVVVGEPQAVDWSELPGVTPLGHTHPSIKNNDLPGNASGRKEISLDEILRPTPEPLIARELVFPSAPDFLVMAHLGIDGHRVYTPYVIRDRMVMKPTAGENTPRLEFKIGRPVDVGKMPDGRRVYRSGVIGSVAERSGPPPIAQDVWIIQDANGPSGHLYMAAPPEMTAAAPAGRTPATTTRATVPRQSLDTLTKRHGEPAVRWARDSLLEHEIEPLLVQLTPEAITTIEDIPAVDAQGLIDQIGAKRVNDALSLGLAGPVRGKHLEALRRNVAPAVMTDLLDSAGTNRGRLVRLARVADGIEPAGALLGAEPLTPGSVAIDSNVRIAIDELVRGVGSGGQPIGRFADLPETRQNAISAVRQARGLGPYVDPPPGTRPTIEAIVGPGADLRTTQLAGAEAMVNETGISKSPTLATMKGTATHRSHPDYALVIEELKNASIGANKGAVDRSLIADAMFAENAAGSPPKLVTADEAVCVGLARRFARSPRTFSPTTPAGGRYWEQLIARFPEGLFTIDIRDHKLEVYFHEPTHAAPSPS